MSAANAQRAVNPFDHDSVDVAFSDEEFAALRDYLANAVGIEIPSTKKSLIKARLSRRLQALALASFDDYLALLRSANSDEVQSFINSLTTNVTAFFREAHHFDDLRGHLETLRERGADRVRLWSAGCSNGAEAYSMAMVAREVFGEALDRVDLRILATDIDTDALEHAHQAVYSPDHVDKAPQACRRYFEEVEDGWHVVDEVRELVTLRWLNLIEPWPMSGLFDAIFCRNVVIYFDPERQNDIWARAATLLKPGARLYVGHSETLGGRVRALRLAGRTTYQKSEGGEP